MLYITYAVRYFFEAVFSYLIFTDLKFKDFAFKKENILELLGFCTLNVSSLMLYRLVETSLPISRLISLFVTCIYFFAKLKKLRTWNHILSLSIFISVAIESSHILSYVICRYFLQFFGINDVMMNYIPLIVMCIVIFCHLLFMSLTYYFDILDSKLIEFFSEYKATPILLFSLLFITLCLKHFAKQVSIENVWFLNIISISFLFLPIFLLIISQFLNMFTKLLKQNTKKQKVNLALEEAKKHYSMKWSGMHFISEKFNLEMNYFKNELEIIGMDKEEKGNIQTAFAAVLLNHEENIEKVAFKATIYTPISNILLVKPETVEANISNTLNRHWYIADSKMLEIINQNYNIEISKKNGAPTPKKFLISLVKKYKARHKYV